MESTIEIWIKIKKDGKWYHLNVIGMMLLLLPLLIGMSLGLIISTLKWIGFEIYDPLWYGIYSFVWFIVIYIIIGFIIVVMIQYFPGVVLGGYKEEKDPKYTRRLGMISSQKREEEKVKKQSGLIKDHISKQK